MALMITKTLNPCLTCANCSMRLSAIGGDRLSELYMLLILFTVLIVDKVDQGGSDPWMILCFIY